MSQGEYSLNLRISGYRQKSHLREGILFMGTLLVLDNFIHEGQTLFRRLETKGISVHQLGSLGIILSLKAFLVCELLSSFTYLLLLITLIPICLDACRLKKLLYMRLDLDCSKLSILYLMSYPLL